MHVTFNSRLRSIFKYLDNFKLSIFMCKKYKLHPKIIIYLLSSDLIVTPCIVNLFKHVFHFFYSLVIGLIELSNSKIIGYRGYQLPEAVVEQSITNLEENFWWGGGAGQLLFYNTNTITIHVLFLI